MGLLIIASARVRVYRYRAQQRTLVNMHARAAPLPVQSHTAAGLTLRRALHRRGRHFVCPAWSLVLRALFLGERAGPRQGDASRHRERKTCRGDFGDHVE